MLGYESYRQMPY